MNVVCGQGFCAAVPASRRFLPSAVTPAFTAHKSFPYAAFSGERERSFFSEKAASRNNTRHSFTEPSMTPFMKYFWQKG